MSEAIVFAGIAPHPPLLVPEVGRERTKDVADSERALKTFSERLVATRPESLVIISPHSPLDPRFFTARSSPELQGDFGEFRAPSVRLKLKNDLDFINAIERAALDEDCRLHRLQADCPLDHGAMVPLYYLAEAGWSGPIVVIGFTLQSNEKHLAFGGTINRAAKAADKRIAVVASGDLSHRLTVGGPYEFEPTAHFFDEQIVRSIAGGEADGVLTVDPELRERAGECGYRSIVVALGAVEKQLPDAQVLSYEGPFGVGYMVAVLVDRNRQGNRPGLTE